MTKLLSSSWCTAFVVCSVLLLCPYAANDASELLLMMVFLFKLLVMSERSAGGTDTVSTPVASGGT